MNVFKNCWNVLQKCSLVLGLPVLLFLGLRKHRDNTGAFARHAGLAFALLGRFLTPLLLNGMVAFIAGVMLQVCAAELLPESFCYARRATAACGFCTGCALMFAGLYLV